MYKSQGYRACAALGYHIYATGGLNVTPDRTLKTVQRYDPTRDCWEPVKDMPVGRTTHATAVLDNHLYVIGGREGEDRCSSRVDRFDPARNEWESVAPLAVGRAMLVAVTVGDRIYAIGGMTHDYASESNEVEAYDAVSNTWTPRTPMSTARTAFAAGVVNVAEP